VGRFRGEDVMSAEMRDSTTTTSPSVTATATATVDPNAVAVVGSQCGEPGATGTTADGATVYCTQLQYTNRYLWSVHQDQIPNPLLTTSPLAPPPSEDESPVRICMAETGHSRLRCAADILRGNGG
jgi:serine/threonine-protein kinase